MRFRVKPESYEKMKPFTNLLHKKGINFNVSAGESLTIDVQEDKVREFLELVIQNGIKLMPESD